MKAVSKHSKEKWILLYIERWLKASIKHTDGREEVSRSGTPQGGVISPLLANLYLHYAFDIWITKAYPTVRFERFADDVVIHCQSEVQAAEIKTALSERLKSCGLKLHPEKTKMVYCKDNSRKGNYENISYTFLGYTFRPRGAQNRKTEKRFLSFLPAASREAQKRLRQKLKDKSLRRCAHMSIEEVADYLNPLLRGWFGYFSHFYKSELYWVAFHIDNRIMQWASNKHKWNSRRPICWLNRIKRKTPELFAHWNLFSRFASEEPDEARVSRPVL